MKAFIFIFLLIILITGCTENNIPAGNQTIDEIEKTDQVITMKEFKITSPAFEHNKEIPSTYTCDRVDVSPPLKFENVPEETKSIALIVDDPDAPMGTWVHWIIWNLKPDIGQLDEDYVPSSATQGINDFGKIEWGGPCPPSGKHRYFFKAYALDIVIEELDETSTKKDLEEAMHNHIIAKSELIGLYEKE